MLSEGVERRVLDNGLTVLVKENQAAPVVGIYTYVKVGYLDEPDRLAGISHLIEHMFFKGTRRRGVGDLARETKALGGYLNASTIYDHTLYYTVLPARHFTAGLDIQSDALKHSVFDPEELRKETEVVIEEAKRKLDRPSAVATEKLLELAFEQHRMRRWRIGTEEGLRALSREDVIGFYKNYYRPENIILTVVGDIAREPAFEAVEKYYGDFEPGAAVRDVSPPEPPHRQFRYRQLRGDLQRAYLTLGFHTPGVLESDTYALEVLAFLLGHGRSSRLFQNVREAGLVDTISASNYAIKDLGILTIQATADPDNLRQAEAAIFESMAALQSQPISEEELVKARNALQYSFIGGMESVSGQADVFSYYEALGDVTLLDEYVRKLSEVTPQDILRVANTYLRVNRCSLLEYVPERAPLRPEESEALARRFETIVTGPGGSPARAGGETPGAPWSFVRSDSAVKEVERHRLANGLTVIVRENRQIPLVATGIYARGGRRHEHQENSGITGLALRSALKGTQTRAAADIAREIEGLGASISPSSDADYFGYSMNLLSSHFERGWEILTDVVTRPTFPPEEVQKETTHALARISRARDDMFQHPLELFNAARFGTHAYGLPVHGLPEVVSSLGRDALYAWHTAHFTPDNMVVAFVGDVEASRVLDAAEQYLEALGTSEETSAPAPSSPPRLSGLVEKTETREKAQTALALGFAGPTLQDEDCYPLAVLQNVVSGLGGRFFEELRGRQSLAYTVMAFLMARAVAGSLVAYIGTSPEKEEKARTGLLREFEKLTREPVTDKEIREAIEYTVGTFQIRLETNRARLAHYAHHELVGRGIEEIARYPQRIARVTREDLLAVARKYVDLERYAVGIVRGKSGGS